MTDRRLNPLPYVNPGLATGSSGYRMLRYPSDDAGVFDGRVADDGNELRLEPSPFFSPGMIPLFLLLAAWGGIAAYMGDRDAFSLRGSIIAAICLLGFFGLEWSKRRRGGRLPWIVVDRRSKRIRLPRPKREIPYASVVRLQLVSFAPVGVARLGYRGVPLSGELQIVFNDAGREQTWCLVNWPDPEAVKSFSIEFRQATGIPVSRVYPTVAGDWHVEPFDGMPEDDAAET